MDQIEVILAEDGPRGKAGSKVQLAVQPIETYDPTEVSSYASGFHQQGFLADLVAPELGVDKEIFKLRSFDAADVFQLVNVKVGHEDEPQEIRFRSSLTEYRADWRMIGSFVNVATEIQQGPNVNPRMAAARRIMHAMKLYREWEVFSILLDPTKWGAGQVTTLDGTTKWNGGTGRNIYGDLAQMVEDSEQEIDFFVTSRIVANLMLQDTAFQAILRVYLGDAGFKGTVESLNMKDKETVIYVPNLPPIYIAKARIRNESTGANDRIVQDAVIGIVSGPIPTDGESVSTMKTARLKGMPGSSGGVVSREYDVPGRGPLGGRMLVISTCEKPLMLGPTVGGLLYNVIQ
jgi:hypothetical protein